MESRIKEILKSYTEVLKAVEKTMTGEYSSFRDAIDEWVLPEFDKFAESYFSITETRLPDEDYYRDFVIKIKKSVSRAKKDGKRRAIDMAWSLIQRESKNLFQFCYKTKKTINPYHLHFGGHKNHTRSHKVHFVISTSNLS